MLEGKAMNRRDMIVIAALLNSVILALLLALATTGDNETPLSELSDLSQAVVHSPHVSSQEQAALTTLAPTKEVYGTDFDQEFQDFALSTSELIIHDDDVALFQNEPDSDLDLGPANIVDITVKSGDALEKIARANGTTVAAIKSLNQLKNERLKIGQILKVPVGTLAANVAPVTPAKPVIEVAAKEATYYTIKSGDNPWKIAKQFHVRMDELLKLNNLDEEKARNLKVGDRIRIH